MRDEETGLRNVGAPADAWVRDEAHEAITADAEALFYGPPPEIRAEQLAPEPADAIAVEWVAPRITRTKTRALGPVIVTAIAFCLVASLVSSAAGGSLPTQAGASCRAVRAATPMIPARARPRSRTACARR